MADKTREPIQQDVLVDLGDMRDVSIAHLKETLDQNDPVIMKNYEEMAEDFMAGFNHMIIQGVPPEWALFAFSQSFAIVLGRCIRAGFSPTEGGKLIAGIIKNAQTSAELIRIITGPHGNG